jgi:hypothetical protein
MATTEDRRGRVPGLSEQVNERLASLDTGLREGLREIHDELRAMNTRLDGFNSRFDGLHTRLDAKASTWLVGAGIAWLSLLMALLTLLTRR